MLEKMLNRTNLIEKALDASWLRNEVIAQNIANVDTPGYKRKSVAFEDYLSEYKKDTVLKGPEVKGLTDRENTGDSPAIATDSSVSSTRYDGNNVDIEAEMALMAKNNLMYSTLVQRISGSFNALKSAINEGRK